MLNVGHSAWLQTLHVGSLLLGLVLLVDGNKLQLGALKWFIMLPLTAEPLLKLYTVPVYTASAFDSVQEMRQRPD